MQAAFAALIIGIVEGGILLACLPWLRTKTWTGIDVVLLLAGYGSVFLGALAALAIWDSVYRYRRSKTTH